MTDKRFPMLAVDQSLPEPMTALDPNSWAYDTVTRRWPEIIQRLFIENDFDQSIQQRLKRLIADIPESAIRSINDSGAPDSRVWNQDISHHAGKNWLEPPWFFTEHYFYRRVIEAIGYFQYAEGEGLDPFTFQKKQGLEVSKVAIRDLVNRVEGWKHSGVDSETLIRLLYLDLWGNQADLSMWPADGDAKPEHRDLVQAREFLLEDRAVDVADYIGEVSQITNKTEGLRIDFLIDNAGFELVSDLVFADYLLSCGIVRYVRFHVKSHPTYVSDAMIKDVVDTLDFFKADGDTLVNQLGARLEDYWVQKSFQVRDNFFWTSPIPAWDMPSPLKRELSQSILVISKGDANYRRLLGDLNWPNTTLFSDILAYFPAPIVALRTIKAEITCGMQPGQASLVASKDPDWMIDGQWGVVQFSNSQTADG